METIESKDEQAKKITTINQKLEAFIQSKDFFRTKAELDEAMKIAPPVEPGVTARRPQGPADTNPGKKLYETLYDNIFVRTLTKSTTTETFKALIDNLKLLHQRLNRESRGREDAVTQKLAITLPEGLVMSFSPPRPTPAPRPALDEARNALLGQIQDLTAQQEQLKKSKADNTQRMAAERQKLAVEQPAPPEPPAGPTDRPAAPAIRRVATPTDATNAAWDQLLVESERLQIADAGITRQLTELNQQLFQSLPRTKYARVGDRWIDATRFEEMSSVKLDTNSLTVHSECEFKSPFQVADLKIVEQLTVGYVPGKIAHIHNTQQGELHEKFTERINRTELSESLMTDEETFRETDNRSAENLALTQAASEVQSEESSFNINASVSGTYGVVTASVDAGYSNSQSSQSANIASQSYAREIVQRVVERATSKITRKRSSTTIEQFTERVKHVIDNRNSTAPKNYVYRWLTELVSATLLNFDKRLFICLDLPYPAANYLSRSIKEKPGLDLPTDPRELAYADGKPFFKAQNITRANYLPIAEYYDTKLEPPPAETLVFSYVISGSPGAQNKHELVAIPEGYRAISAYVETNIGSGGSPPQWNYLSVLVGRKECQRWVQGNPTPLLQPRGLDKETKFLPISIFTPFGNGFALNIEVECELEESAFLAWQVKCYHAILEAYDNLKAKAEGKMSEFDPSLPGLHPMKKKQLIKTELKKGALSKMFRCNPFWIKDNYEVGKDYDPACCTDTLNGERVRFLETLCDWNNMTYEFYPYLYADKDNWARILELTDDDPHFESFLQASFATVRIPVHRDPLKEIAAVNFVTNNSIANYEVVPAEFHSLLDELDNGKPTKFTTGLNGEPLDVPTEVIDLGIFPVPTDLVILECGVESGIKPIGFKQVEAAGTTLTIPKQYSPEIIGDRCSATPGVPNGGDPKDPVDPKDPIGVDNKPTDSTQ